MPRRLRAFFRTRTLQGSTGQFALSGKDAILSRGGSPIFTYIQPDWLDPLPTFSFTQGVTSTQSFSGYFIDGNGGTSTITGANLPAGVTVNSANRTLVYDGSGAVATSSATLMADDGYNAMTNVTTLVIRDSAGTAGMVFKEGDVPSGWYIASDLSGFQAEVKNWWPDGSAKIAVLSWSGSTATQAIPATINVGKTQTAPTGSAVSLATLRGLGITGSVTLGAYGSVDLATTVQTLPFRQWQAGPQCSEWHWRSSVGADLTLVVWFYVRLYASGRVWVRVIVENGYVFQGDTTLKQSGKQYRGVIRLRESDSATALRYDTQTDSSLSFPQTDAYGSNAWYWPWSVGSSLPHSSRTRWSKEFWYDGSAIRTPGHSGAYCISTKLFPNYSQTTRPSQGQYDSSTWVTSVIPLGRANHRPDMTLASGDAEIAYLPKWDVMYLLAVQGSANQERMFNCIISNAVAAGTYGFVRDEATNLPVVWADRQYLWAQQNQGSISVGSETNSTPYRSDMAHQPSWAYSAYLFSGDYLYLETMQEAASRNWMSLHPYSREGSKGLMFGGGGVDIQPRLFAWVLRNHAHALCCTPDSSVASTFEYRFAAQLKDTMYYNAERQLAAFKYGTYSASDWRYNETNTMGQIVSEMSNGTLNYYANEDAARENDGIVKLRGHGNWQQYFIAISLGAAVDMKLLTGAYATKFADMTDFCMSFVVQMCGLGDSTGFPYVFAGTVCIPIYAMAPGSSTWVRATSWSDVYDWRRTRTTYPDLRPLASSGAPMFSTYGYDTGSDIGVGNGYAGSPGDWAQSYWANLQPALSYAVDLGVSGAAAARARILSQAGTATDGRSGDWATHAAQLPEHCQWNVVPR